MQTTERPGAALAHSVIPEFTEDEIQRAAIAAPDGDWKAAIASLYEGRRLATTAYARANRRPQEELKSRVVEAIDRRYGLFCLVNQAGTLESGTYQGREAADQAATESDQVVLLKRPIQEPHSVTAARFLKLFLDNEALVDCLLERLFQQQGTRLNMPLDRTHAIRQGKQLLMLTG